MLKGNVVKLEFTDVLDSKEEISYQFCNVSQTNAAGRDPQDKSLFCGLRANFYICSTVSSFQKETSVYRGCQGPEST